MISVVVTCSVTVLVGGKVSWEKSAGDKIIIKRISSRATLKKAKKAGYATYRSGDDIRDN
jgi:hypothetical protein